MRFYRAIERLLLALIRRAWIAFVWIHEIRNILSKRRLYRDVRLTEAQKKEIDAVFLRGYGRRFPYAWHRLYQSYTGRFDARYMPEILFATRLEPYACPLLNARALADKQLLPVLFDGRIEGLRTPRTLLSRVRGGFYDASRRPISRAEAEALLSRGEIEAVAKISVDSSSGRGVRMLRLRDGLDEATGDAVARVFDAMGPDFVVQERIIPHPALAKLYPDSVNTFRLVTYRLNDAFHCGPLFLRMGQGGKHVDNAHAGGIFVAVSDDGRLHREAFNEYRKRYDRHPDTGVAFDGCVLPFVPKLREAALALHGVIPTVGFVGWDLTVDSEGRIVLLEVNLRSQSMWMGQMAHGRGFFGENTEAMLEIARHPKGKSHVS